MQKRRNKRGRGDLVLKNVNLGGHRHLVLDVAVNHEFGGDNLADVSRNGALRDAQPARILENTARTKVARYRAGYAEIRYAFLPCVISTSGRLHGEFLRLLYIIAHRRTTRWFQRHSNDEPSEDAFKFRRSLAFGRVVWAKATMLHNYALASVWEVPCFRLTGGDGHARLTTGSW